MSLYPHEMTDYSQSSSWYKISDNPKGVDTFFICPTEYMGFNEGYPDYAALDNFEVVENIEQLDYNFMASAYEDSANLFMPYYRRASIKTLTNAWKKNGDIRTALTAAPYEDIIAALNYYFANFNNGRPFIIAGHSQGSAVCPLVLQNYFKEHPVQAHDCRICNRIFRHKSLSCCQPAFEVRDRRKRHGRYNQLEHRKQAKC